MTYNNETPLQTAFTVTIEAAGGVERLDGGRTSLSWANGTAASHEVISLLADEQHRLLIGTTKDGVLASDGKTINEEPAFAILKGTAVRSMARTRDGSLWFGTSAGVYLCRPDGNCTLALQNVDVSCLRPPREKQTRSGAARAGTAWCAFCWIPKLDQSYPR